MIAKSPRLLYPLFVTELGTVLIAVTKVYRLPMKNTINSHGKYFGDMAYQTSVGLLGILKA
jgi:hypothetical protein